MKATATPLDPRRVHLKGGLLGERQEINRSVTVPVIMEKCRSTGRVEAILHQWDGREETRPHPFWDSDIGKSIESAAYALMNRRDEALEADVDEIVDRMVSAQEPDGYYNAYYQACEPPEARWTNLYYMHELYCMGHLIEGAVAYHQATGKRAFLDMMCRYADLACSLFLEGGRLYGGYCGHPEIELALVRLYRETGQERYLKLARTFIDQRGRRPWYFETESLRRGVDTEKTANLKRHLKYFLPARGPFAEYQAHVPVREQTEPVGHAVRAMYLLAGAADVAALCDDDGLYHAVRSVWDATVSTQMAITGGIGTASDGERFTFAYDLPNEITYHETCASVALMMAGLRLLSFGPDAAVADAMERTLYNTILASVSLRGDRFFYANYLDVCPERFRQASKATIDKMSAERLPWFNVACCPPNVSRLTGALGQYVASEGEGGALYVHLYAAGDILWRDGAHPLRLRVETEYPWSGRITLHAEGETEEQAVLWLRIPGWCRRYEARVNGQPIAQAPVKGYLPIERRWQTGDCVELELEMQPVWMEADPRVRQDGGKVALMCGPVVYCLEEKDNGACLHDLAVCPSQAEVSRETIRLGNGAEVPALSFPGLSYHGAPWADDALYRPVEERAVPRRLLAVPYFAWGNRGFGEMIVWMNRR